MAWCECEQLCSAISKNNETKRKISRRLRNNGRQAERFKADLDGKVCVRSWLFIPWEGHEVFRRLSGSWFDNNRDADVFA